MVLSKFVLLRDAFIRLAFNNIIVQKVLLSFYRAIYGKIIKVEGDLLYAYN